MKVIWSPSALREIEQIFDYFADLNPGAASKVLESLVDAADRLVSFPN
jgi:plasmid stabilization system protein ParE